MRYLLLFMALPYLSALAQAPDCPRLKKIAGVLEDKIQTMRFETACEKMTPEEFGLSSNSIGFEEYRCKDLSAINAQLKSLENEIALLNGITGLRKDVESGLATFEKFTNPEVAKEATAKLIKNLAVAQSLELFLATNNAKSENILSELVKADPKEWESLESFGKLIENYCKNNKVEGASVCVNFTLSEDVFNEINAFVKRGSQTKRKFNKDQISDLSDALSIKKGDEKFSFNQLAAEIKVGENGLLSADDFKKIKELPPLSNNTKLDFLKEMKASIKDLKESEQLVGAQAVPDKFKSLMNDLKQRQQWEIKSKLSLILHTHASKIPDAVIEKCQEARELKIKAEECLGPLSDAVNINDKLAAAVIDDYQNEIIYGEDHLTRIDEVLAQCTPTANLEYPAEKCDGMITKKMDDLVGKAAVLNALKAKLLTSSPELYTLRNYALEQLKENGCMKAEESNIGECTEDLGSISREAIALSDNAGEILYLFTKSEEGTDISHICSEGKEKVPHMDELCALDDDGVKESTVTKNDPVIDAKLNPNDLSNKRALGDFTRALAMTAANYFAPRPTMGPMTNPYQNTFPYVPMQNQQPVGISDRILSNHGYVGSYSPTPGLAPYSSVTTSNVTTYAGYTVSNSRFSAPVGW